MNATPRNCFIVRISRKLLKKGGALWRDRVASIVGRCSSEARGRKSKCVTPPKGRKAGETHRKKESEDWTDEAENQPEQNARRPRKIAPSRGICGKKKKKKKTTTTPTKIKERKCIFFLPTHQRERSIFRRRLRGRSAGGDRDRNLITRETDNDHFSSSAALGRPPSRR